MSPRKSRTVEPLAWWWPFIVVAIARTQLVPIGLREANEWVRRHHRHHKPSQGHKFSVALADGFGRIHAVAIVGRPRARHLDRGWTAEVLRVCSDGFPNACSALYATCWRAARAMGYRRLITYTLPAEGGGSLEAANWKLVGEAGGGSWSRADRPRIDSHPTEQKSLWEVAQ